jgi:hypothetical protein
VVSGSFLPHEIEPRAREKSSEKGRKDLASNSLSQHYSSIINLPVVEARKGVGSFLFITLGISTASHELWVYMCDWELRGPGEALIACSDAISSENAHALCALTGHHLADISSNDDQTGLYLRFDGDYVLFLDDASDLYGAGSEMLVLFEGGEHVNTYVSSGGVQTAPGISVRSA